MAIPTITSLPPAPIRGEPKEVFTAKANAFLGKLAQLQAELNTLTSWADTLATDVNADKNTTVTAKNTAVAAKNTAVLVKDTAVAAKNTAVSARDTAVTAKNTAVTKAAEASASALLIDPVIDPLPNRVPIRNNSGDIYARLFRSAFATQTTTPAASVQFLMRNSTTDNYLRPVSRDAVMNYIGHGLLHADALRISGANIQLVKRNGSSEAVNVGLLIRNLAAGAVGTTCLMRYVSNAPAAPNTVIAGSLLRFTTTNGGGTVAGAGTWRVMGQFYTGSNVTVCMRIS